MSDWEQSVSGDAVVPVSGDAAVPVSGDAAVPVSGDTITIPPFQTYWDFGNTAAKLEQTDKGWRLSVCLLKSGWTTVDEWSLEEYDKVSSWLLPVGFEPELDTEKFCFFEKEQHLFLKVIGKDGRTYIIHPDTKTVLEKKKTVLKKKVVA